MLFPALLVLGGCGDSAPHQDDQGLGAATEAARSLDTLARETGALPDSAQINPQGSYGRGYEGGSDRLCLVPEQAGGATYRFGAETRFGGDEYCRGEGVARLAGNTLILSFDKSGPAGACIIVAQYEGDRVVMPGSLDLRCAALCSARGSFAGVSFPRTGRDLEEARRITDRKGNALCR